MSALADSTSDRPTPQPASQGEPLLSLRGVGKSFGAVQALAGVDLDVPAGQVTAPRRRQRRRQVGAHQVHRRDPRARPGADLLGGPSGPHPDAPRRRRTSGSRPCIRTSRSATTSTSCRTCSSGARTDAARHRSTRTTWRRRPRDAHEPRGDDRAVDPPAGRSLSGGQRQSVAIAKAVLWNTKLVIMDEPTAALGVAQTAMVLDLVRRLADRGLAVIIISHNMNDVFQVADQIAVLHLGRMVAVRPAAELDRQIVVDLMTTGASTRTVEPRGGLIHGEDRRACAASGPGALTRNSPAPRRPRRTWRSSPSSSPSSVGEYLRALARPGQGRRERRPAGHRRSAAHLDPVPVAELAFPRPPATSSTCSSRARSSCLLAMGEVFALLLGEIDLSIGFVAGIGGVVMAELVKPANGLAVVGGDRRRPARMRGDRRCSRERSSRGSACRRSSSPSPACCSGRA